jgi:HEAT repeat protein
VIYCALIQIVPKAPSIEQRLDELDKLADDPQSPATRKELRKNLANAKSIFAARAAQIAANSADAELIPDLTAAFRRFMKDPLKTDKGCLAKTKIMKALLAMECDEEAIYLEGVRHVQSEPAFGGPIDTAVELRALSALGLVQMGSSEALYELINLLADNEADARIGAVRALAATGRDEAVMLIRLKSLTGDAEPAVIAECFIALMSLSPKESLRFVAQFVDPHHPNLCESAALALGESHLLEAFEILKEKWKTTFFPQFRRMLLLPIALIRREPAIDFLLGIVETGDEDRAAASITALAIYRDDPKIRERVKAAIPRLNRATLLDAFKREFG